MKKQLRSSFSTQGRRMAGARALWAANGMKKNQMGNPLSLSSIRSHSLSRGMYTYMKSVSW